MKDRPILFSGPMVRAILNGSKTQTRRVAKLTANGYVKEPGGHRRWHTADFDARLACPYGLPGERLWVRETWRHIEGGCVYDAAGGLMDSHDPETIYRADRPHFPGPWKPAIHMPRWASRITLEVTGVRAERLQDISEADALAEGIVRTHGGFGLPAGEHFHAADPRQSYLSLWEAINGEGSVGSNPWVWVVDFRRTEVPT